MTKQSPFKYFKTITNVIRLVVMLSVRFPLSLRNVEDLLHERGVNLGHETVRYCWNRFGPVFAAEIRRKRIQQLRAFSKWKWNVDEVFVNVDVNSELLGYVHNHLSKTLENLGSARTSDPLSQLKIAVIQCSEVREFGPRAVSEKVGLSYRQAQRLVAKQGTTIRTLIDENRMAIAADFLREGNRTMDEIAATLGYADDRAFRRAFKRRFQVSPSRYRRGNTLGKSSK